MPDNKRTSIARVSSKSNIQTIKDITIVSSTSVHFGKPLIGASVIDNKHRDTWQTYNSLSSVTKGEMSDRVKGDSKNDCTTYCLCIII